MLNKNKRADTLKSKSATVSGQKINYRSDQLIVKLKKESLSQDEGLDFQKQCQRICDQIPTAEIKKASAKSGRIVYVVSKEMDMRKMAKEISKLENVAYAEVDVVDEIQLLIPSDSQYSNQWSHQVVNSERAWDITQGNSTRVLIGIIDSGISFSSGGTLDHSDLNSSRYISGTDFVDGGTPRDFNAHGTHVVGIAAAESNNCTGVAGMDWKSKVYICRTLNSSGNGNSSDFADAVEEIVDYALANNYKAVINYSAGGGDNQTKRDACEYAHDNGMILCAAAGNDNGGPVISPALHSVNFDGVIAVGSTDIDDSVSSFSNVGPEITVVAPGRDILSTTPTYSVSSQVDINYDQFSGTSMASPLVAGIIALMWSRKSSMSNVAIRRCLIDSAVKLGAGNFNNSWGFGRVDAYEAVSCIRIRRFCFFPPFTIFTNFTNLTAFTSFTPFTPFTRLTPFTNFTPFTRFTGFEPFTQPVPFQLGDVKPFVKFRNNILAPEDLSIDRFKELEAMGDDLRRAGINYIDELATEDVAELSKKMNDAEKAKRAIVMSQEIFKTLS